MLREIKNEKGFTLIELLVVIIIVAILAAVGIPLLSGNTERARATEAVAGLSTIRTGMRADFAEHAKYAVPATLDVIGIKLATATTPGDLDGRYFSMASYIGRITSADDTHFCAGASGAASVAVRAADVATLSRSMNQDGTIFSTTDCSGTALN